MFPEYLLETYSEKVAKGYIKDFQDFLEYINEKKIEPEKTTETDVREYIHWLREEKEYTNKTVTKKISLLRKYFKWLRKNGEMVYNPMDDIQQPKIVEVKNEITEEERSQIKLKIKESKNIRDQVIFGLLMDEGVKPNEMIGITFKDCDLEKRMVYLEKKAIAISEETASFIIQMKKSREDGFLLTNQHGHPLKESGIYWVIKNYLAETQTTNIRPMNLIKKKNG